MLKAVQLHYKQEKNAFNENLESFKLVFLVSKRKMNMSNLEADLSQKDLYKIKAYKGENESFVKGNVSFFFFLFFLTSKDIFKVRKLDWKGT